MGAVMGYSEQHTLLLMTTDEEVDTFLNVSMITCRKLLTHWQLLSTATAMVTIGKAASSALPGVLTQPCRPQVPQVVPVPSTCSACVAHIQWMLPSDCICV